jgi:hypothetical protein
VQYRLSDDKNSCRPLPQGQAGAFRLAEDESPGPSRVKAVYAGRHEERWPPEVSEHHPEEDYEVMRLDHEGAAE